MRWIIGDIHGNLKALLDIMRKLEGENIIFLGDYTDGYPETLEVMDFLSAYAKVTKSVFIKGNHDVWLEEFLRHFVPPRDWLYNGGKQVYDRYKAEVAENGSRWRDHLKFLENCVPYYMDEDILCVHGGFYEDQNIEEQPLRVLTWDRELTDIAAQRPIKVTSEGEELDRQVFIGHTATYSFTRRWDPILRNNLINLDTGAGYAGRLTAYCVETGEYIQSDFGPNYYLGYIHR